MKTREILNNLDIWTTNEESKLLKKLKNPIKLSELNEHDQYKVQTMIRKNLVSKIGFKDPMVVANEK